VLFSVITFSLNPYSKNAVSSSVIFA
jgi:hypothetical protein